MPDIPKETKADQEALKHLIQAYSNSKKANAADLERFSRYYKLFRGEQTQKNYNGLANLFVPEPYRIVRKKSAKLANAIKNIKVTAEGPSDVQGARVATQLLNFLRRKLNWFLIEKLAIQESRIVGLSWIKCTWQLDNEEEDRPYKGFDFSLATADSVFLSPGSTILDVFNGQADYLIHEYESDIETLKKNKNYDKLAISILEARSSGQKPEGNPLSLARMIQQGVSKLKKKGQEQKHKIQEYWGKYVVDKNE